jgi:ABC-type iron transport system FetAB permease component
MAYFTVIHLIAAAFPRYSIPLRPLYYGMAMFACSLAFDNLRSWHRKRIAPQAEKAQPTS